jgi:U3 small nucleolar RNA-associated protein 15
MRNLIWNPLVHGPPMPRFPPPKVFCRRPFCADLISTIDTMAAEVTTLPPVRPPAAPATLTPDQKYWASFSSQILLPSHNSSPVTYISTNSPSLAKANTSITQHSAYIAVTTGPRLQLISPQTLKPLRSIARTASPFHGATIRTDGRVCLAGSDSGSIQAFDTGSRAILKTWTEHKQPVWVTKWHPRNLTEAMSTSDDATVRLWDLPAEGSTWTGYGHTDYVRSGSFVGHEGNLLVTGSYDRTIRLWDTRIGSQNSRSTASIMQFKLAAPVEAVLPLPGGTTVLGTAGNKLAVLDLVAARPLHLLQNHQKTITSLALASQGSRVLTGALDGHVKVFDTSAWTVLAGFKYPSPVLSLAVVGAGPTKEDRHLCVGMQSGLLSVRTRLSGAAKAAKRDKDKEMAALVAGTIEDYDLKRKRKDRKEGKGWEKRVRGKDFTGEGADIIVHGSSKRGQLKTGPAWEKALRGAKYGRALDLAMESKDWQTMLTLLTALVHRSALRAALEGRDAARLVPILKWTQKHIADPRYVRLLSDVAMVLLDLYGQHLGESPEVDALVEKLHDGVRQSAEVAQLCWSTMGMLDLLQAGAGG